MATRDDVLRFLSGGVVALIPVGGDGGTAPQGTQASPAARPEETKPEPQLNQTEAFLNTVTRPRILMGTVIAVAVIGLFLVARR